MSPCLARRSHVPERKGGKGGRGFPVRRSTPRRRTNAHERKTGLSANHVPSPIPAATDGFPPEGPRGRGRQKPRRHWPSPPTPPDGRHGHRHSRGLTREPGLPVNRDTTPSPPRVPADLCSGVCPRCRLCRWPRGSSNTASDGNGDRVEILCGPPGHECGARSTRGEPRDKADPGPKSDESLRRPCPAKLREMSWSRRGSCTRAREDPLIGRRCSLELGELSQTRMVSIKRWQDQVGNAEY